MKNLNKKLMLCIMALCVTFSACSKNSNPAPPTTNGLGSLNATWETTAWGGVSGNDLTFAISAGATTGLVTQVGSESFNFAVGDKIFTDIVAKGNGTYSCMGKYTYGTNNATVATRAANITLQNNATQITVDYPEIDADFPEIIYVYQKQ